MLARSVLRSSIRHAPRLAPTSRPLLSHSNACRATTCSKITHLQLAKRSISTTNLTRANGYRRWGDVPRVPSGQESGYAYNPGGAGGGGPSRFRAPPTVVVVLVGGGGIYYIANLEKVPETGRWRFMDTSRQTELQLGVEAYQDTMRQYGGQILPDSHPTSRFVLKVAKRIIRSNGLDKDMDWTTHVVKDDETQNAFVLPGGHIFVFTGILPVCENENGLAVVLGHEIAHQVARHSAERYSSMKVLMALSFLLNYMGLDFGLSRMLLNLVMTLPNSRKSESEADYIGLRLSNQACYDPREAPGLWHRMSSTEGASGNVDFLSTHPSSGKREKALQIEANDLLNERPDQCGPLAGHYDTFRNKFRGGGY